MREKTLGINRKLWIALANDKLKRRKEVVKKYSMPCETCTELLMCSGIVGTHICSTIKKMQEDGLISGPKRIPFQRLRRKLLPISEDCLIAYGLLSAKEDENATTNITR